MQSTFTVKGMTCDHCKATVEGAVKALGGVKAAEANLDSKIVSVDHDGQLYLCHRFAGDDRFTVNFGAGFRFLLTDTIALRLDFRDHLYDIDLFGEEKTVHNLEGQLGLTVFF